MALGNAASTLSTESFVYSGNELDAMAEARNYCRWILRYFEPHLGPRVVEIGAGVGTFSELLLNHEGTSHLALFEAAHNLFPVLQRRFAGRGVFLHCGFFNPAVLASPTDSIVLVNVLEHVLADTDLLVQIYDSLRANGRVLLFVPALQWNYGSLDKAFEHQRRYGKRELATKLQAAGFRVKQLRFVNAMGIASWFFAGRVMRQSTLNPAQVRWYDHWVVPWSFRLENAWEPPLGQSLLAVGVK